MTNAEARFNHSLRPRKPEGSLGRTAQDVHLESHTAPELCQALTVSSRQYQNEQARLVDIIATRVQMVNGTQMVE